MGLRFKIEYIQLSKPVAVISRQMQQQEFYLGEASTLGGCKVQNHLTQPRALNPDGSPNLDLFVFYLANGNDRERLCVGKEVELVP